MYDELKKLAEGMKGWDKMSECWPCDENGPDWQVGRLDEDDNRWPLLTVDTAEYDQEQDAPKIARYYAAANPSAVLALIADLVKIDADRKACWAEFKVQGRYIDQLRAENEALRKDAERYRFLRDGPDDIDFSGVDTVEDMDATIDSAMSKEAS